MTDQVKDEAIRFFDEFVEAFRSFDGNVIAIRYMTPYLAMHIDGQIDCFNTQAQVAQYFQTVLDEYHAKRCRSCCYHDLEVLPVGSANALITVSWELIHLDGSIVSKWRESYNVSRAGGQMRVFASIDHAA